MPFCPDARAHVRKMFVGVCPRSGPNDGHIFDDPRGSNRCVALLPCARTQASEHRHRNHDLDHRHCMQQSTAQPTSHLMTICDSIGRAVPLLLRARQAHKYCIAASYEGSHTSGPTLPLCDLVIASSAVRIVRVACPCQDHHTHGQIDLPSCLLPLDSGLRTSAPRCIPRSSRQWRDHP